MKREAGSIRYHATLNAPDAEVSSCERTALLGTAQRVREQGRTNRHTQQNPVPCTRWTQMKSYGNHMVRQ